MGQLGALPDFSGDKLWLSGFLERAADGGPAVTRPTPLSWGWAGLLFAVWPSWDFCPVTMCTSQGVAGTCVSSGWDPHWFLHMSKPGLGCLLVPGTQALAEALLGCSVVPAQTTACILSWALGGQQRQEHL